MSLDLSMDYFDVLNEDVRFNYTDIDINPRTSACPPLKYVISAGVHVAILMLVSALGVTGNISALLLTSRPRDQRSSLNTYLFSLAANDLLFALTVTLWAFCEYSGWIFGDLACKVLSMLEEQHMYTGVLLLACVCAHTFRRVNDRLLCVCAWVSGVMLALPKVLYIKAAKQPDETITCFYHVDPVSLQLPYIVFRCVVGAVIPTCIFLAESTFYSNLVKSTENRSRKEIGLILTVMLAFILFRSPFYIAAFIITLFNYGIIDVTCQLLLEVEQATHLTFLLCSSHCCVNPLLFSIFWNKFKVNF